MRIRFSLCLLFLVGVAAAQEKPSTIQPIKVVTLDRKEPVTYEKDVEPILVKKCFFCHSGNVKEGKFDISTYENLMKGGKRGQHVLPGKGDESFFYKVSAKTARPFMPPKSEEPLTPEELALIKLWIDQGAKAPTGAREKPKIVVSLPPANVTPVRAVAVSPDKSAVAAGRGNQIHVYDAGSGNHIRTLVDPNLTTPDKKPVQAAHVSLVESLAFSPDGKYLASGSFQEVFLWDVTTGEIRQRFTGYADRVVTVAFSPDGKLLAVGGGAPTEDGEIKVYEVPEGKPVMDIKGGHSDQVFGVAFSPDGKLLATCSADKFVKVWEVPSGTFVKSFEGHTHHVLDVGWKPDGKLLASGGADNAIKIWDYEKGEQKQTVNTGFNKQITRLIFVGKTNQFAVCTGDAQVRFYNVDNGGQARNLGGSSDFLYGIGASADGTVVAVGGEEGIVRLYSGANANQPKNLLPPGVETPKK